MDSLQQDILTTYGNKLRVRACGIAIRDNEILLVKHHTLGKGKIFWSPPGGGIQFGETAADTLAREFMEETHLQVKVGKFLFVNEFLSPPLHAIELFFEVQVLSGELKMGSDPEMHKDRQIIQEVRFFSKEEIRKMENSQYHHVLGIPDDISGLLELKGYFKNEY